MAGSPTQAKFKPTASAEQADTTQLLSGLQTKTSKTMFLVPTSSLPPRCPGIAHRLAADRQHRYGGLSSSLEVRSGIQQRQH